jgi:aminoglycoside phosphotransferase (APT) family kinase protein
MSTLPTAAPEDDPALRATLAGWLEPRLDAGPVVVTGLGRPRSGYSAETVVAHAEVGGTPRRFVLRKQTPDPPIYPQQGSVSVEVEIQYRVMAALAEHSDVPVAPLVGYEAEPDVLGAPFFVMQHVDGEVPVEDPPYPSAGFFADARPEERRTLVTSGLEVVAAVHRVDWRAAGLDWLAPAGGAVPGSAQQLALWRDYAERELDGRPFPELDDAFAWVADRLPADEPVGLCWGDGRPGNIIFGPDFRPRCATDFEAASIASPDQDLGWWLMFDRTSHEFAFGGTGMGRPEGDPSREEQVARYAEASGRTPEALDVHEVFAAARYEAIVCRVMNRLVARGDVPADHTIWRENPAASCLVALVEELVR